MTWEFDWEKFNISLDIQTEMKNVLDASYTVNFDFLSKFAFLFHGICIIYMWFIYFFQTDIPDHPKYLENPYLTEVDAF